MTVNLKFDGSLKMLREHLCSAQSLSSLLPSNVSIVSYMDDLQQLINQIDTMRPLGPDGKHGDRHTQHCGCEDLPGNWDDRSPIDGRHCRNGHALYLDGTMWRCEGCGHKFDAAVDAEGFYCGEDCAPYHAKFITKRNGSGNA